MIEGIIVEDVNKRYAKSSNFALNNLTLRFEVGKIHILLGPNGSGKSTLLKILGNLISPTGGKVLYQNSSVKLFNKELKKNLGFLFDHSSQWEELTGYENAWFFAKSYCLEEDEICKNLEFYFKQFQLWEKKDDLVKTYSYGMRRKLALIEIMMHDPQILLLDEPSMGMDYQSRMTFYKILKERASNKITIISSNDVNEAAYLADSISILRNGNLLVTGAPQDLMKTLKPHIKIELKLMLPISLDGLKKIEGVNKVEIDDSQENDFIINILAEPKTNSNYSFILSKIITEIVNNDGQLVHVDIKSPNLGDLFLKYKEEDGQ